MSPSQVTADILNNPRYAGAIGSVEGVTNWIDVGFGMAITMVSFLIILVAMLKNVLAAAYCAYPKFWDRVDAAHKEVESVSWMEQIKGTFNQNMNTGSLSNALFRILPNIKNVTDFEGDTIAPKTYFIRAIPQMLACMIIGAFIYNGFYRDTAAVVVDFGSTMVNRFLLEVDPVAVYDQFTGTAGRPEFASDDATDPSTQLVNKIATTSYTTVIGTYNDIKSAEAKRALATALEMKAQAFVNEIPSEYKDRPEEWLPRVKVTLTLGEVDISGINGKQSDDKLTMQYANTYPVSDLGFSSNKEIGVDNYVRIRLNFEKQVVKTDKRSVTDIQLQLAKDHFSASLTPFSFEGMEMYIGNESATHTIWLDGQKVCDVLSNGRQLEFSNLTSVTLVDGMVLTITDGLTLKSKSNSTVHKITSILIGPDEGTMTSVSETAYGMGSFDFNTKDLGRTKPAT